jgi:hypothetical protein
MSKQRSPNYPQYSLPVAIEKVRAVYRALHTQSADIEKVILPLGYNSLSGSSRRAVSALRQYALLGGAGDALRVTNTAVTILERQPGHPDRITALKKAAFSPTLFHEISQTFGFELPESEDLRIFLVNKGFSRTAVSEIIDTYRDTLELVTKEGGEYDKQEDEQDQSGQELIQVQPNPNRSKLTVREPAIYPYRSIASLANEEKVDQELRFRISADSEALISFWGEVTQEAIEKLIKLLELSKDTFPSQDEIGATLPMATLHNPGPRPDSEPQQRRLDETVPGGRYVNAQGILVDANNKPIDE